jgi:hypothetical protein
MANEERRRLDEADRGERPWKLWGPYLSERQWGTVREDYSANGDAWGYFPHDHARSRAYRWGEDGLAGVSDEEQRLCFALALWNGKDPILKERLFGLTGPQGNHGEDVKELYYYLDSGPTHSYMRMLYKYPQAEYPYARLLEENARRGKADPELELLDTGVLDGNRYFDVFVEYAKAAPEDLIVRVTIHNRGPETAELDLLPQLWFRNTWSWGDGLSKPRLAAVGEATIEAVHPELGVMYLHAAGTPELLFTENETNVGRLWGRAAPGPFKDAFHDHVVQGAREALAPERRGTKAAARYRVTVAPERPTVIELRLCRERLAKPFAEAARVLAERQRENDAFHAQLERHLPDDEARAIQRQALAGMLWSKQFYHWDVPRALAGDPGQPPPPDARRHGRNSEWLHLNNADVISMPDKWEYPWYAAWDLAFHCLPLALVDCKLAKDQLLLLTREWYMHPNGQLPAYEWNFSDTNPPVHAWAAWLVYQLERDRTGRGDLAFLERMFHKLMLNFTWWVNRKDVNGRNVFQGGFLGLDNIGVFDRSAPLPTGGHIDQADGTSWMAMFCLNLMQIALELARHNPVYQDVGTKFFEHFLYIAAALNDVGGSGIELWDPEDEFFYDVLHTPEGMQRMKVRSMVGLIPLFAVEVLEPELLDEVPEFRQRLEWFLAYRPDLARLVSRWQSPGQGERRLLSLLRGHRMKRLLSRMLDETEFLSPYGVRALSRVHAERPYVLHVGGTTHTVSYEPGESGSNLFGGNSNWRGPVWFPVNGLIVYSLRKFHQYYGDDFRVECPTGSGRFLTLDQIADELSRRLVALFRRDGSGRRPVHGDDERLQHDPHFRDHLLFYEYFHGDTGRGVGASHQTGWTGLVAALLHVWRREAGPERAQALEEETQR